MPPSPRFSICILCYTRADLLTKRLEEINAHCSHAEETEVLVGDNGSPNRAPSLAVAERLLIGFRFALRSHRIFPNSGFGRGFNALISAAAGDFIICLSDDVEVHGDFMGPLDEAVKQDPNRLFYHRIVDWSAGWNQFGDRTIPYPEGFFLAASKAIWTRLEGGFDERYYPNDYEDVDLGMKAREADVPVCSLAAPLYHPGAQTLGHSGERMGQTYKMRAIFAEKWALPNDPERP